MHLDCHAFNRVMDKQMCKITADTCMNSFFTVEWRTFLLGAETADPALAYASVNIVPSAPSRQEIGGTNSLYHSQLLSLGCLTFQAFSMNSLAFFWQNSCSTLTFMTAGCSLCKRRIA